MRYVLITAARDEEKFIAKTLESVIAQTQLPERWVIVDDGSTDRTAEIVRDYANRFHWIELVRAPVRPGRSFAGKAQAVNMGLERVRSIQFEVIGNLDADVSFEPDYMEFLMQNFSSDPDLGVAGTPLIEDDGYDSAKDSFEGENHVAGPCQLFRYECFQDIGGYVSNPAGGIDWVAVMTARMKGWQAKSFPEKRLHHHRRLGTAGKSIFAGSFFDGKKDYYLGGSFVWQLFRVAYQVTKPPVLIYGLGLLLGYCSAAIRRAERPVSKELIHFHRREQMKKLRVILGSLIRFKKVDSFSLTTKPDNQTTEDRRQRTAVR